MWCSNCQQDSPAAALAAGRPACCAKCGNTLPSPVEPNTRTAPAEDLFAAPLLTEEDWMLEAELRGVKRLVASLKATAPAASVVSSLDAPHPALQGWHAAHATYDRGFLAADARPRPNPPAEQCSAAVGLPGLEEPKSGGAAWMILSLGLAAFACGAVLLGWSFIARRDDLWPIGMPLALVGQAGLILGLILQLDGLWNNNRR